MLRIMSNKVKIKTETTLRKIGRCRAARSVGGQKRDVSGVSTASIQKEGQANQEKHLLGFCSKIGCFAHGLDDRPVEPNRIRKSVGKETTLFDDIGDTDQMLEILENIAGRLENSLIKREAKGRTITLKAKYFDFQSVTRSITIDEPESQNPYPLLFGSEKSG